MITNKHNLPRALVRAVERYSAKYSKGRVDYSATELLQPALIHRLRRDHADEIVEDVVDRLYALQGQMVHKILEEGAGPDELPEIRLYSTFGRWRVSGQVDTLIIDSGELFDYKTCSVWSAIYGKPEWEAQLNILAELVRRNGGTASKLGIVALLRDWKPAQAAAGGDYPQAPAIVIDIPIWEPERVERYVMERCAVLDHAKTASLDDISQCSPEERWQRPATWAIVKAGRKTAVRVYDSQAEAQRVLDAEYPDPAYSLVERPGIEIRCEYYCNVRAWCPYKTKEEVDHEKRNEK